MKHSQLPIIAEVRSMMHSKPAIAGRFLIGGFNPRELATRPCGRAVSSRRAFRGNASRSRQGEKLFQADAARRRSVAGSGLPGMSLDILLNTYGHHHPDYLSDAVEKIAKRERNIEGNRSSSFESVLPLRG